MEKKNIYIYESSHLALKMLMKVVKKVNSPEGSSKALRVVVAEEPLAWGRLTQPGFLDF